MAKQSKGFCFVLENIFLESLEKKRDKRKRSMTMYDYAEVCLESKESRSNYFTIRSKQDGDTFWNFLFGIAFEAYMKNCLKLPTCLGIFPPFAIFSTVELFSGCQLESDFILDSMKISLTFDRMETQLTDEENEKYFFFEVLDGAEESHADATRTPTPDLVEIRANYKVPVPIKFYPQLTYLSDDEDHHIPLTVDHIEIEDELPPDGSKFTVYVSQFVSQNCCYGSYKRSRANGNFIGNSSTKSYYTFQKSKLCKWMNTKEVVKTYKEFGNVRPRVNEMVIVRGRDRLWHRGLVTEVMEMFYTIFYIDLGYTLSFTLASLKKFPREFTAHPFHSVRLVIANVTSFPEMHNKTAIEILQWMKAMKFQAEVVGSRHDSWQPELSVLLKDASGVDIKELLEKKIGKKQLPRWAHDMLNE